MSVVVEVGEDAGGVKAMAAMCADEVAGVLQRLHAYAAISSIGVC